MRAMHGVRGRLAIDDPTLDDGKGCARFAASMRCVVGGRVW
jgi:hypothetical protein